MTNENELNLLPCPFCGCAPSIERWHGGKPTKRMVSCENDGCFVAPCVCGDNREDAAAKWNARGPAKTVTEEWVDEIARRGLGFREMPSLDRLNAILTTLKALGVEVK